MIDREGLYSTDWKLLGFSYRHAEFPLFNERGIRYEVSMFGVPLWPLLPLLLVVPVRWLIARPTNAPAFPVVTEAKLG